MQFFQSPVTSSLFGPNILLSTLFSNNLSLCSSLNGRDQVTEDVEIGFPPPGEQAYSTFCPSSQVLQPAWQGGVITDRQDAPSLFASVAASMTRGRDHRSTGPSLLASVEASMAGGGITGRQDDPSVLANVAATIADGRITQHEVKGANRIGRHHVRVAKCAVLRN
jgi:hypothetical protein